MFYKGLSRIVYVRNSLKCSGFLGGKWCKFQIILSQQLVLEALASLTVGKMPLGVEKSYFYWRIVRVMEFSQFSSMMSFILFLFLSNKKKGRFKGNLSENTLPTFQWFLVAQKEMRVQRTPQAWHWGVFGCVLFQVLTCVFQALIWLDSVRNNVFSTKNMHKRVSPF